jgi:hypothetical protein
MSIALPATLNSPLVGFIVEKTLRTWPTPLWKVAEICGHPRPETGADEWPASSLDV